jgi:gluconokinase
MTIVLMGVTGSGKTTIGELLSERLGWRFYDADDFHSPENKAKMHAGVPLTDDDRLPWLASLRKLLVDKEKAGENLILACSALRRKFRRDLSAGVPDVKFVHLKGSQDLIAERLAERKNHYMNPDLLGSQFDALEEPEEALTVDISGTPEKIAEEILDQLGPQIRSA